MKPISMFDPNSYRVSSGGRWGYCASSVRVADRLGYSPSVRNAALGFRPYWNVR